MLFINRILLEVIAYILLFNNIQYFLNKKNHYFNSNYKKYIYWFK